MAPTTSPYVLTAVDNYHRRRTGLPVIAANDNLTIVGNGDTIERSTAAGTPAFRLFDVAAGASLTLQNLTLQGGLASEEGLAGGRGDLQPGHSGPERRDRAGQHRPRSALACSRPAIPQREVASTPAAR